MSRKPSHHLHHSHVVVLRLSWTSVHPVTVSSSCLTPDMHAEGAASSSTGAQTSTQSHVILFRTPHPSLQADPYHRALLAALYHPRSVPVLTEAYHTDELAQIIKTESYWSGVVISSKRAAKAWIQAARAVEAESFFGDCDQRGSRM